MRSDSFFSEEEGRREREGRFAMVADGVGDNGVIGDYGIFRNRREKELCFWASPEGIDGRA